MSEAKIVVSAQDNASRVLNSVRASMGELGKSTQLLTSLLGGLGIGALAGMTALTKSIVNGLDAMNDLKDATGASIENISALEDVAARTGTSFDTVGTSLVKFNQALNNSDEGSKTAKALEAIGLSAKELKAIDPAEALRRTAVALAGFADDGNKARLTQELFGKSLKDVAPFLKDLAEQGSLVAKVTTEQAQAAEDFNKQLFALQKNAIDVGRSLVSTFLPALVETSKAFADGTKAGKGFLEIAQSRYWENVGKFYDSFKDGPKEFAIRLEQINTILKYGQPLIVERNALLREQAELQKKLAQESVSDAGAGRGKVNPQNVDPRASVKDVSGTPSKEGKAKDQNADYKQYLENLQRQIEKTKDLSTVEQLLVDIRAKRLTVTGAQEKELTALAATVDQEKARLELQKEMDKRDADAAREREKYLDDLLKESDALAKSNEQLRLHVEEIGLTTEGLNALKLSRLDNALAMEQTNLAMANAMGLSYEEVAIMERRIELLKQQRELTAKGQVAQAAADTKKDQDAAAKDFAQTLQNDLKGAFSAAFRDSKDPIGAFGDALSDVMYSRASTALTEALLEAATSETFKSMFSSGGGSGGSSGGSGGGWGELFSSFADSFDGGGSTGRGPRSGGLDGKGGFMAMLHPQETVLDHTRGQGSGGSVSVVVNVDAAGNTSAQSDSQQAKQLGAALGNSIRAVLLQEKRPGGLLAA